MATLRQQEHDEKAGYIKSTESTKEERAALSHENMMNKSQKDAIVEQRHAEASGTKNKQTEKSTEIDEREQEQASQSKQAGEHA